MLRNVEELPSVHFERFRDLEEFDYVKPAFASLEFRDE
jgi:hypothetical protein